MTEVTTEAIINALDSVTWNNGIAEIIVKWKDEGYLVSDGSSLCLNWNMFDIYDTSVRYLLEAIWTICVELFGDYGTSPRSGWIELENKDSFYKFIDDITESYRDFRERILMWNGLV